MVPPKVMAAVEEIQLFLQVNGHDDTRVEITAKGYGVQTRDGLRARRFSKGGRRCRTSSSASGAGPRG